MNNSDYNRDYYQKNKTELLKKHTDWNKANRTYLEKWRDENPEKYKKIRRKYHFKAKYGTTLEYYDELLLKQGGVCAICKTITEGKYLYIDHCHVSGKIRGLLCNNCNVALGYLKDSIELLKNSIIYLETNG